MQLTPREKATPIDRSSPDKLSASRVCFRVILLFSAANPLLVCQFQLTLSLFANFRSAQVELRYEPPITMFSNLLGVQRNRPRVKKPPRLTRIAPTSWTASRVDCIELGLQLQGAKPTSKNQFSNFPRLILES
ncbi:hypothetical protein CDL15_Pgr023992 [Punica granatum]|uniref:Uncharacterized protein n=1 Tax=Punica granatum TaxID=22663 RepID=A0A218XVF5_PUNGR|nr:hypothetical protein CDL15_Pgr023992 [Punica granatum]